MSEENNHIEEYFSKNENLKGNDLFRIDDKNVDLKTELTENETRFINTLKLNDDFLERQGLIPIYKNYYKNLLRLLVSKERKGRREYVEVHTKDNSDDVISKFGNLSNISNVRK